MRDTLSTYARIVSDKQASVIRVSGGTSAHNWCSELSALVLNSYKVIGLLVESTDTGSVSALQESPCLMLRCLRRTEACSSCIVFEISGLMRSKKIFERKTHAVLKSGTNNIVQRLAWVTRCQRGSRQLPCFADLGSQAQKTRVMHWGA